MLPTILLDELARLRKVEKKYKKLKKIDRSRPPKALLDELARLRKVEKKYKKLKGINRALAKAAARRGRTRPQSRTTHLRNIRKRVTG